MSEVKSLRKYGVPILMLVVAVALGWYWDQLTAKCALTAIGTTGSAAQLPAWLAKLYCSVTDFQVILVGVAFAGLAWKGVTKLVDAF